MELLYWEGEDISPEKDDSITRNIRKRGEKKEYPKEGNIVKGKKNY